MKKRLSLLIVSLLLIASCGNSDNITVEKNADGSTVISDGNITAISPTSIPYDNLTYGDDTFSITSVDFYQGIDSTGFEYSPYIIVSFDLGNMSEKGEHWLMNNYNDPSQHNRTFRVSAYLTSNQNNLDFDSLSELYCQYKDHKVTYAFYSYDNTYKNDFSDMELSISADITQDETTTINDRIVNLESSYSFYFNGDDHELSLLIQDLDDSPQDVRSNIYNQLNKNL